MKNIRFVLIIAITVLVGGCATWTGEMLPKERLNELTKRDTRIDYLCRSSRNNEQRPFMNVFVQERVEDVLKRTGAVAGFALGSGIAPVHVDFDFNENLDEGAAVFAGLIGGLSGTLIPVCTTAELEMKVSVSKGGSLIKEYKYPNEIKRCTQFFLMFYPSEYGLDAGNYIMDDMVLRFLLDAQKDGIL